MVIKNNCDLRFSRLFVYSWSNVVLHGIRISGLKLKNETFYDLNTSKLNYYNHPKISTIQSYILVKNVIIIEITNN